MVSKQFGKNTQAVKRKTRNKNTPLYTLDCETDPFEYGTIPVPFIWGLYRIDTEEYEEFSTVQQMIKRLKTLDGIVYAHNGGKFDFHYLSDGINPDSSILVIAGRLVKCEIGTAELRDSYSILPFALGQYQKTEIEYWKLHKLYRAEYMQEIRDYLKSDCVNLANLVSAFISEYGLHITQATAAMNIWSKMTKTTPPRTGAVFYDTFSPYYYGGRVQCFKAGDIKVNATCLDINSAYPFAMLQKHPMSNSYIQLNGAPKASLDWSTMFFDVKAVARGCFPFVGTNEALYFPSDNVERLYQVTGHELLAAIETDSLDSFTIVSHYQFSEVIDFKSYIEHFWTKRQAAKASGDKAQDWFCKIFMNGLYGKFAANPSNYFETSLAELSDLDKVVAAGLNFDYFGKWLLVQAELEQKRQRYYNIATAASITGLVRAMLWRALCKSNGLIYCDTDSITAESFTDLQLGNELGQWKLEAELDRVVICGKKLYAMHKKGPLKPKEKAWKVASKGARLDHNELIKIAAGESVTFKSEAPTYSVHRKGPVFVDRIMRFTAADASKIPVKYDPTYSDEVRAAAKQADERRIAK